MPCRHVPPLDVLLCLMENSSASAAPPVIHLARICTCSCATLPINRWIPMDGKAAAPIRGSIISPNRCGWPIPRCSIGEQPYTHLARRCRFHQCPTPDSSSTTALQTTASRRSTAGMTSLTTALPGASSATLAHARTHPRAQRNGSCPPVRTMGFIPCMCASRLYRPLQKERCIPSATPGSWIQLLSIRQYSPTCIM